jgi:hypothetical protein
MPLHPVSHYLQDSEQNPNAFQYGSRMVAEFKGLKDSNNITSFPFQGKQEQAYNLCYAIS